MTHIGKSVFLFDGPIGVGKTTLGQFVAARLGLFFIDRDDHAGPGPWIQSVHRTSRSILAASITALETHPGGVVAGPVRCVEWLFFVGHFRRFGVACHCIGLRADSAHIESRVRALSPQERRRSRVMSQQGYGARSFSQAILHTDSGARAEISSQCESLLSNLMERPWQIASP